MTRTLFPLILLLSSIGCGVCLEQPLHSENTLFFTPELLGEWKSDQDHRIWRFSRNEGKSYSLGSNLSDATKTVYLTRLDGGLFMTATNLTNADDSDRPGCRYILSGRIVLQDGRLTLRAIDVEAMADLLGESTDPPPHHILEGQATKLIVFTGDSQSLQRFLSAHADASGLFDGASTMTFTRIADPQ